MSNEVDERAAEKAHEAVIDLYSWDDASFEAVSRTIREAIVCYVECADKDTMLTKNLRAAEARAEAAEAKVTAGLALAARLQEHPGGWGEHEAAAAIIEALGGGA